METAHGPLAVPCGFFWVGVSTQKEKTDKRKPQAPVTQKRQVALRRKLEPGNFPPSKAPGPFLVEGALGGWGSRGSFLDLGLGMGWGVNMRFPCERRSLEPFLWISKNN